MIDAINAHEEFPFFDDLGPYGSSESIAKLVSHKAHPVKAFNTLDEDDLASGPRPGLPMEERIAIPLCGDDSKAKRVVSALIEEIGFAPVDLGTLVFSHLLEPHRSLYSTTLTPPQMRLELVRYERGQNSN